MKYRRQDGQSLFSLWWVLVTIFPDETLQTILHIKSYDTAGLCSSVVRVLSVSMRISCPSILTCILQQCAHHKYHPCFTCLAQVLWACGLCWWMYCLGAVLGSPLALSLACFMEHPCFWCFLTYMTTPACIWFITTDYLKLHENIWLSSVCAEDCHIWPFLYLHQLFIVTIYETEGLVSSAQEPSGEFLKWPGFPPKMWVHMLNVHTGLGTIFHPGKS